MQLSLFTVICAEDLELIKLQARSIARYCPRDLIKEIVLFANGPNRKEINRLLRQAEALRGDYGPLADRLKVASWTTPSRIAQLHGWTSQQIAKLEAHLLLAGDHVVILDGKNHFVRPIKADDFFCATTGKPRMLLSKRAAGHFQHLWLEDALRVLGLALEHANEAAPQTVTPFPVLRQTLAEFAASCAARSLVLEHVLSTTKATEFFLISAHVIETYGGYDAYFAPGLIKSATIFRSYPPQEAQVLALIEAASRGETHSFAVHPARLRTGLSPEILQALVDLWQQKGLCSAKEGADICRPKLALRRQILDWVAARRRRWARARN